jgi:hypothetical protein
MQIVSTVRAFIVKEKTLLAYVAGVVVCAVAFSFIAPGCSPKVSVPANIAKEMATPAEVPLAQAVTLLEDYRAECERRVAANAADIERLTANVEAAEAWQANMNALLWQGIDTAKEQAKAIPGLGGVLPLIAGLAGLFMPRPRERQEKEASYAKGRKDAINTLAAAKVIPSGVA